MAREICDICHVRSAARAIKVIRNGEEQTVRVCDADYPKLMSGSRSPFESLFGGGIFDDLFRSLGGLESPDLERPAREAVEFDDYLSDETRKLLAKAEEVARRFGRDEIDTEHLLYAIADSAVVRAILKRYGLDTKSLQGDIDEQAPKSRRKIDKELDVSPRLKNVLELAFQTAQQLGVSYVGPEHLLVALSQEEDGLAGDILRTRKLTAESLGQAIAAVVGKGKDGGRIETPSKTPLLDQFSRDLTRLARQGKLDPVIGRAGEIETMIEVLSRRTKNNPVLIGEPGVGKTAIAEGLAQRIVNDDVPETLLGKRVVELSLGSLVAGTRYRGDLEERVKRVLDEILGNTATLILFIDELHAMVGAGSAGDEGSLNIANMFKPHLARGDLHLIGATTLDEYQKYIEKDAALERRFQPIYIAEPTIEQTVLILRGLRDRYEAHHKVKITDEAMVAAAELSNRFVANRFLPDKAIDLVDQAASRVRILTMSHSREMQEIDDKLSKLKREQDYAASHREKERAIDLKKEMDELAERRKKIEKEWRKTKGVTTPEVTPEHIAQIVSKLTGIPVAELTQEERDRLLRMEEKLHERIIGQEEPVAAVSNAIRTARAGLTPANRPIASFLFLGPSGVGKTELAKTLAWAMFGSEEAVVRIDMSEYTERHTVARLVGAPPGYVGYEEGGQLTEAVRRRPYAVILLDEMEKAHPDVYNILLQLFDEGRLTDGKGRVVDFTNTIIIATSNLGSEKVRENLAKPEAERKSYEALKNDLWGIVREHFRPEFINRIDEVIVFHALSREQIKEIVRLQLGRVSKIASEKRLELAFDDSAVDHLAEIGFAPEYGARELNRKIKTEIENPLAKELLLGSLTAGDKIAARFDAAQKKVLFKKLK